MDIPKQKIVFHTFSSSQSLPEFLKIKKLPISSDNPFRQLSYIHQYLIKLDCKSLVIENHYIDQDYIEDHSIFYSKNLYSYQNFCQRVHFFLLPPSKLKKNISEIILGALNEGEEKYHLACQRLSQSYLGFCVIRPLWGCPVGRTVLTCFGENANNGLKRRFDCTRDYRVHLAGVELSVRGLAFQQQDVGVSACATTALWSAFHRFREIEDISPITPAQITNLASRFALPFGRSMPSEGLSLDQMCQAIQAIGISPYYIRVRDQEPLFIQKVLYSATASGFPSVLILKNTSCDESHAVTVAGMKVDPKSCLSLPSAIDKQDGDLKALYIHDDRYGPYLRADINCNNSKFLLKISFDPLRKTIPENWELTHVLIPLHSKIRMAFGDLWSIALDMENHLKGFLETYGEYIGSVKLAKQNSKIKSRHWIFYVHSYIEKLLLSHLDINPKSIKKFLTEVPFSRYFGIIEISSPSTEPIHIILDSTSTKKNITILGVLPLGRKPQTCDFSIFLSQKLECDLIV